MKQRDLNQLKIDVCFFCRDAFTDLMSSGTLTSQSHLSIPTSSQDFSSLIKNLCQTYRLTSSLI